MSKFTTPKQFTIMVEFMETHGDISKPFSGPNGRLHVAQKWEELTALLNGVGCGGSKTSEKWRKVWSDLKSNTKRKAARLNSSYREAGPVTTAVLTEQELKVLDIINVQAATGNGSMAVEKELKDENPLDDDDWNQASTSCSSSATVERPQEEQSEPEERNIEPTQKKRFTEADMNARYREFEKERDRILFGFERERLRQRERELELQGQWLELAKEVVNVVKTVSLKVHCMCKKNEDSDE